MKTFNLSISTPIGKNFETDQAVSINAWLLEGRIGVMANHTPLVSSLKVSTFTIQLESGEEIVGVTDGGIFSVTEEGVTILTTRFEFSDEVIIEETNNELKEAEYLLQDDVKGAAQKSISDRITYANLKLEIVK